MASGSQIFFNRSLLALQQVARRGLSGSARKPVDNVGPRYQKGSGEALVYRVTLLLSQIGTVFVAYKVFEVVTAEEP